MKADFFENLVILDLSLYPTWFRWKFSILTFEFWVFSLYIPHGSDEREPNSLEDKLHYILYIPHGSDESSASRIFRCRSFLFISHMVQMKAREIWWLSWECFFFISHMVQMKGKNKKCIRQWLLALYPTWFRWKLTEIAEIALKRFYFISHMVQMKVPLSLFSNFTPQTFISHMVQMKVVSCVFLAVNHEDFISHMVQMKDKCIKW